jgi:hypothetical protein
MYIDIQKLIELISNPTYAQVMSKLLDIILSSKEVDTSQFNKAETLAWNTLLINKVITTPQNNI